MNPLKIDTHDSKPILTENDVVTVRQIVKKYAIEINFKLIDQTKLITAASEIARNALIYGGGGLFKIEIIENENRMGIKLVFEDHGPGIPDIDKALKDGFTSGKGMGLGLSGSKRLMDEFYIDTQVDVGTTITLIKWR